MRRGVCFDLDGTLLRPHGDWHGWVADLATALGLPDEARARFRSALETTLRADGALTLESGCRDALAACALPEPSTLPDVAREACDAYGRGVRAHPAAAVLLEALAASAVPVAVVTNGPADMQTSALRASGLATFVHATIVSGAPDVAVRKPHARAFWLAVTALRVRPDDALMVGDDLEADVRGAHRFGMATCWVAGERAGEPPTMGAGEQVAAPPGTSVVRDLADAGDVIVAFSDG